MDTKIRMHRYLVIFVTFKWWYMFVLSLLSDETCSLCPFQMNMPVLFVSFGWGFYFFLSFLADNLSCFLSFSIVDTFELFLSLLRLFPLLKKYNCLMILARRNELNEYSVFLKWCKKFLQCKEMEVDGHRWKEELKKQSF